jgi:Fe2+ or Zn2+ uptake regulation protein
MTRQRQVILDELKKVHTHPTADQVYKMTRERLPRISLGTVYRNLEILSACGLIQKLKLGSAPKRFDGNAENHYHIRCVSCGRVDDLMSSILTSIEEDLCKSSEYKIIGHRLEFLGVCPRCKDKRTGTQKNMKKGGSYGIKRVTD